MKQVGIYRIRNIKNNRLYIGSSIDIVSRIKRHKYDLRINKHSNKYLQNDWNKCGADNFVFEQVESCAIDDRFKIEQQWIDKFFDNKKQCYNIVPVVQKNDLSGKKFSKELLEKNCNDHKKQQKTFVLVSPDGKLIKFKGMRKFCREQEVKFGSLWSVLKGKTISAGDGWRLPKNKDTLYGFTKAKTHDIKLLSPDGKIYDNIFNLEQFCKEHNIESSSLRHVIAGKMNFTNGWSIADREIKKRPAGDKHHNSKKCIVDGIEYGSILEAEKKLNLCPGVLWRTINLGRKKYKNYVVTAII